MKIKIFLLLAIVLTLAYSVKIKNNKSHSLNQHQEHEQKHQALLHEQENTKRSHKKSHNLRFNNRQHSKNKLELNLKHHKKSAKKRLEQVNQLSKHQASLMQKESYTHVHFDQQKQEHVPEMIQLNHVFNKPELVSEKKPLSYQDYVNQRHTFSKLPGKNLLKVEEKTTEKSMENEQTQADLPLYNHQNTFFTGQLGVGDADDLFNVIFDTGSSLTFINSVICKSESCKQGSQYDSEDSDSHQDMQTEVEVEFGSGTLTGDMATEDFYVNSMKIPDTLFIEITEQDGDVFDDGDFDGIVGLSFPDLADDTPTLFDFMMKRKVISDPVFAFYMNRQSDTQTSKVTFGGFDESLVEGDVNYHEVTQEYYWMVESQQLLIGDQDTGICSVDKPCKLVLDSGTSLFTGPPEDLTKLLSELDTGDEGCRNLYDLPDITFVIDGQSYPIQPEEYILTVTKDGTVESPYEHSDLDDVVQCVGAFYGLEIEEPAGPLWVMGDVFMSKYYTIFERGAQGQSSRIGLGKAKQN